MSAPVVPVHVGLDIGGTKVLGVAVDERAQVLAQVRLATEPGDDGVVDVAERAVRELAKRLERPVGTLAGVGVGVPGVVTPDGVIAHAVNLGLGGGGLPLADRLSRRTGLPVTVDNDVNAAALGAATLLGLADLAYLSIGTGLAAGVVLRGRVHRGARGGAGEIGHVPVDPTGPVCACGQRGCLEALVSGSAIARDWPGPPGHDQAPADALFAAAAGGDERAVAVARRVGDHLAAAVQLLVLAVDVDVVVLGGGVADLGTPLLAAVADAAARRSATSPFLASLDLAARLRLSPPRRPVAAVGAALLDLGRSRR